MLSVDGDRDVALTFSDRSVGNIALGVGGGEPLVARRRLLERVDCTLSQAVFMQQAHGAQVARVGRADGGRGATGRADAVAGVDGLVTSDTQVALVVQVADCLPILLADPGRSVAALHAGREGMAAGVLAAGIAALAAEDPTRVSAVIGPAIGGCCYEVPDALQEAFVARHPAAATTTSWGTPALDLPAAARSELRRLGVERIQAVGGCTRCHPDRWFSHRAEGSSPSRGGRQAGAIIRHDDGALAAVLPASSVHFRP